MYKRILLAYDGSDAGQKALLDTREIAQWSQSELFLIAVMPSALAASHRSEATRVARCQSLHPDSGDQLLRRADVDPVGSMHHTRPRRLQAHSPGI